VTLSLLMLGETWFPDCPGGAARFVRDLGAALQGGVDVHTIVVGPVTAAPPGVEAVAHVHDPLWRRLVAYRRAASAAAEGADVVETHFALYALLPLLGRRFSRTPHVVHFHGPWAAESESAGSSSRVRNGAKRAIESLVYHRADHVIVHSHAFKRLVVEGYGLAPWNVHVLPPGVDLEHFAPGDRTAARVRLGLPQSAHVVVSVRRLVPRMGLDVLLSAAAMLKPGLEENLVLVIGGDGPERAALERRASELGLGDTVRFTGRLDEAELTDVYRAADVSVVPSVALEGFGLVVLEALACGTPVLASDVGGLAEALAGLDPTLVVPPAQPAALAERLTLALEERSSLPDAPRCRRHAEQFSWSRSARLHAAVYEQSASRRSPRRKLRVVYLDHCARLSGAELALLRLLRPLGDDIDAHVVLAEDGPLAEKLRVAGISHEVLELHGGARDTPRARVCLRRPPLREALSSTTYALRLARRLRRLRPDLVHANSLKSLLYGGVAGRLAGVPVVWHVHDRIASDYLPADAVRLVGRLARVLPSAVIANSRETLQRLEEASGGLSVSRAIVYDPVDLEPHGRVAHRSPLRVGILGRLAPWKGQHLFLDAFARAFGDGSETAAVIGAPLFGEDSYAESLPRTAAALGISKRVAFAGFRDDIAAELAELDVLVHASLIPEPLGQVVQEGMRAGLPVVAAGTGGPAEVIDDGRDGLLYPMGDAAALGEALVRLARSPDLRARIGAAAAARARAFDPELIATQVLDVYEAAVR
jgi:glycosyltransferase involved in cell wall biosynthesis